jgi:hypothetical protein
MTGVMSAPTRVREPRVETHGAARLVAVGSVLVGAAAHVWVIPEHLAEWLPAGVFFVVVSVGQVALAWRLRRSPSGTVLAAGLLGTIGLVVFYVMTRTVDLPFLPAEHAEHLPTAWGIGNGIPIFPGDRIEEVGVPDLVCLAAELVTVSALCALTTPGVRRTVTSGLFALGVAMLVLRLVGFPG